MRSAGPRLDNSRHGLRDVAAFFNHWHEMEGVADKQVLLHAKPEVAVFHPRDGAGGHAALVSKLLLR